MSARRFQPGVGQDQPLGADCLEIDLDASARPRALAIQHDAMTELGMYHLLPEVKTAAGSV